MLVSKTALSVRHAASKDATRYNLNGVRFESDGRVIATDGHRLYTVTPPEEKPDPREFPAIPGVEDPGGSAPLEPFTLPLAAADAVAKAIPKRGLPILKNALLDVDGTNGSEKARFVTTDLEVTTPIEALKIDGDFPDWRQVMPDGEPTVKLALNWQYLADLGKALNEFCPGSREKLVTIEIIDEMSPVKFTAKNPDTGEEFTGLIMPIRPDRKKS